MAHPERCGQLFLTVVVVIVVQSESYNSAHSAKNQHWDSNVIADIV